MLINVPGVGVTVESESPAGLFVSNVLFAVGLLTFAVFIGTVADSISTKVEEVRFERTSKATTTDEPKWQHRSDGPGLTVTCPRVPFTCPLPPQVRTGNYAIVEKNHSVVIGWNDQALPLLRQIAIVAKDAGKSSSEFETARDWNTHAYTDMRGFP